MKQFLDKDFLLSTDMAKTIYHDYAENMPILDYHCHINPQEIYEDRKFENITQVWLGGDHYKWRQMRSNGVDEKYITGDGTDREKFQAWAETMPKLIGNPLYHWSHLRPALPAEPERTGVRHAVCTEDLPAQRRNGSERKDLRRGQSGVPPDAVFRVPQL